ncbi:MAG: class I SAM-dependent methyltransferase [Firmicutes bacterium]|nr:class I SAM-dependent methyltransferase [Bacillota bacterium]
MITPRLDMLIKNSCGAKTAADIGTDHAYVPIRLAETGSKVIATDIKQGPLDMAAANIERHFKNADTTGMATKARIELRLGAGLNPILPNETEKIIIAGMGGEMIMKILADSPETAAASELILQPMNSQYELRRFLFENGYQITAEDIATEGSKVYNLIVASFGGDYTIPNEFELRLPEKLHSHPLFPALLDKTKREFSRIYLGLSAGKNTDVEQISRYAELLKQIDKTEKNL